jgi:phage portal protein BeeE
VLAREMQFQSLTMSPKDTEFISALKLSFEDICRCFGLSPDLLGGERTYANAAEARLAFWQDTMMPECAFLADEITEQILPLFPGQADAAEFDLSGIDVLQEVEDAKWDRIKEQIDRRAVLATNGATPRA